MIQEINEDQFILDVLHTNKTSVVILYSENDDNSDTLLNSLEVASSLVKIPIYKININKAEYITKNFGKNTPITIITAKGTIYNKYSPNTSTDTIFKVIRTLSTDE